MGGMELLFQPRFRLSDRALVGFEASVAHTRLKLLRGLPPGRESRDIARNGAMLREACRVAAGCRSTVPMLLSLRVTEAQAASGMLAQLISEVLCDTGLRPERMELEFSEDSLHADESDMLYLLAALRDLGIGLVLGGFGCGVSSLTLLRRRSLAGLLSGLKLDEFLVRELGQDENEVGFLRGLACSAHALGLMVIAEGIETELQQQRLVEAGCDQGLGPWLGETTAAADQIRMAQSLIRPDGKTQGAEDGGANAGTAKSGFAKSGVAKVGRSRQ
jgi:EAL domain-containing protein (putative c-di-GMP-specific phosphodiesterase class I)